MYFAASVHDASLDPFFIQVWNDYLDAPGDIIYTSDDDFLPITFTPIYDVGVDAFWEYYLPQKVLVSGTFYVGWKQTTSNRLNIGFDKNINKQDRIFYDIGGGWTTSGYPGSLMIRPVFTSPKDALFVGVKEEKRKLTFDMYPNPARERLTIRLEDSFQGEVKLFDLQGRQLLNEKGQANLNLDIAHIPPGLYIVQVIDVDGNAASKKLSIEE